jgi:hypothetical protein
MQTDIIDNNNIIIIENSKMDQATQFHPKFSKLANFNLNIRFPLNRTIIINNDTPNEGIYSLDIFINLACIIPRNYSSQNFEKDYKTLTTFLIKSIKLLNIDSNIVNAVGYKIYSYLPQTFNGQKVNKTFLGDSLPFDCTETCKQLQFDTNFNLISQPFNNQSTFSGNQQFSLNNPQPFSTNSTFGNTSSFMPTPSQPFGSNPFSSATSFNSNLFTPANGINTLNQPFGNQNVPNNGTNTLNQPFGNQNVPNNGTNTLNQPFGNQNVPNNGTIPNTGGTNFTQNAFNPAPFIFKP